MDNNFVNIDDLVRQRLGGGEEQERSGAWLRMNELLDKEMPRDKFGILYWRRMMSAVAVLLLIATISVGGYELSAYRNGTAGNNTTASSAVVAGTPSANTPVNDNAVNNEPNKQLSTAGNTDNDNADTKAGHPDKQYANKITASANTTPKHEATSKELPVTGTKASTKIAKAGVADNDETQPAAKDKKQPKIADNQKVTGIVATKKVTPTAGKEVAPVTGNKVTDKQLAEKEVVAAAPAVKTTEGNIGETKQTKTAGKEIAANKKAAHTSHQPEMKAEKAKGEDMSALALNGKATLATTGVPAAVAGKAMAAVPVKTHTAKSKAGKLALNNHAPAAKGTKTAAVGKAMDVKAQKLADVKAEPGKNSRKGSKAAVTDKIVITGKAKDIKAQKLADVKAKPGKNSRKGSKVATTDKTVIAGKATDAKAQKLADVKAKPGNDSKKGSKAAATNKIVVAAAVKTTNTKTISKLSKMPGAATPAVDNTASKEVAVTHRTEGKKVQKLVLLERYIKITPTEGYFHIDTISAEEFTEQMSVADDNEPAYMPKTARSAKTAAKPTAKTAAKTTGVASATETNDNAANANPQILPGATASANGKPALGTKQNVSGKSTGATALENLSAKFNDIKYQAAGVQFAPGLIAGINGTFFGPSSFNGFQFGFTGNFTFNNTWGVMSALEYFHRINGNYSLNNNYYNYTPINGGGYSQQQEAQSYNFSTLHSIELPLAARYTNGNFSFFAGANFVYNFAINNSDMGDKATGNAQTVPTQGSEGTRLTESDFNSRFGIGCLFGISYQVAPNVTLDIRNVQTLWNSSNSAGAKFVSDQLYKSPSLQFAIGYRLGGNKKDK